MSVPSAPTFGPFSSVWQFLDATVLVAVHAQTGDVMAVPGAPDNLAVIYVDLARAQAMLPPAYVPQQAPVATLLQTLPAELGLVIEIASPVELRLDLAERGRLTALSVPFPPGADIAWGPAPPGVAVLRRALIAALRNRSELEALWLARFQVEDARQKLAVVYRLGFDADDQAFADAVYSVIADQAPSYPVQVIAESDLPLDTAEWMRAAVGPILGHDPGEH